MNERDTHFAGCAKLLWPEIEAQLTANDVFLDGGSSYGTAIEAVEKLIAQRLYDFVYSLAEHAYTSRGLPPMHGEIHNTILLTPDLTAWPEQTQEPQPE